MVEVIIVALLIILVVIVFAPKKSQSDHFGFRGKLVYVDDGKAKIFLNHKYRICAKPDFIFRKFGLIPSYVLVERKSGYREPTESDIAQIKASVITARSRYPRLNHAVLSTKKGVFPIPVNKSSAKLMRDIQHLHDITQAVYRGETIEEICTDSYRCFCCPTKLSCKLRKTT